MNILACLSPSSLTRSKSTRRILYIVLEINVESTLDCRVCMLLIGCVSLYFCVSAVPVTLADIENWSLIERQGVMSRKQKRKAEREYIADIVTDLFYCTREFKIK